MGFDIESTRFGDPQAASYTLYDRLRVIQADSGASEGSKARPAGNYLENTSQRIIQIPAHCCISGCIIGCKHDNAPNLCAPRSRRFPGTSRLIASCSLWNLRRVVSDSHVLNDLLRRWHCDPEARLTGGPETRASDLLENSMITSTQPDDRGTWEIEI